MIVYRVIFGLLFIGTAIGIVLSVLLASDKREQTLHHLHAAKSTVLNSIKKLQVHF
jgi:hypothetical protein